MKTKVEKDQVEKDQMVKTQIIKAKPLSDARTKQLQDLMDQRYKSLETYTTEVENRAKLDLEEMNTALTKEKEQLEKQLAKLNVDLETIEASKTNEFAAVKAEVEQRIDNRILKVQNFIEKLQVEKEQILQNTEIELTNKYAKKVEKLNKKQEELSDKLVNKKSQINLEKAVRNNILNNVINGIKANIRDQQSSVKIELWTTTDDSSQAKDIFEKIPTLNKFQSYLNAENLGKFYISQVKQLKIPHKCLKCGGEFRTDGGYLRCRNCYEYANVETPNKFTMPLLEHKE